MLLFSNGPLASAKKGFKHWCFAMMGKCALLLAALPLALVGLLVPPAGAAATTGTTIYVVPAISDQRIVPTTSISADYISNQISIFASPGEYEPASFVVHPNEAIGAVTATASALTGPGTIDASCVDIKFVKVWWQAKGLRADRQWYRLDSTSRVLAPELLVKDASLVMRGEEIGQTAQNNYVKTSSGYVNADSVRASAVKDSTTLTPVTIPTGTNQQFWVTVRVPGSAAAGVYTGSISLGSLGSISVTLTVLPITLLAANQDHVMWVDSVPTSADLLTMYDHGVDTIVMNGPISSLDSVMASMRSIGFTSTRFYLTGMYDYNGQPIMSYTDSNSARLAVLSGKVQQAVSIANSHGFKDLYIMGRDEVRPSQRYLEFANWDTVHAAGAKVFACCDYYPGAAAACGSRLDLQALCYAPNDAEASAQHDAGGLIAEYGNPAGGCELPETYRRNYGLLLWQHDYDAVMGSFWHWVEAGSIWSDFGGSTFRNQSFALPTSNGNVDTVELQGFREAAEDARYLSTLLKAIEDARALGKATSAAEKWLADLKASDLTTKDLDAVRYQMTTYILSLTNGSSIPASSTPAAPSTTSTTSTTPTSTSSSLVGYWNCNENSGSILHDKSTYGNNGTLQNGTQWTTGKSGSALKFDGVDDYAEIPNSASLNTSQAITIEAWVNLATLPSSMSTTYPGYFGKSGVFWFDWSTSTNKLKWEWYDSQGTPHVLVSSTVFQANTWYHVVYSFDGTSAKAYVNGALEAEETYTGSLASSSNSMTMGKAYQAFSGIVDEVSVWNGALSADKIQASYQTGTLPLAVDTSGNTYATSAAANSTQTETATQNDANATQTSSAPGATADSPAAASSTQTDTTTQNDANATQTSSAPAATAITVSASSTTASICPVTVNTGDALKVTISGTGLSGTTSVSFGDGVIVNSLTSDNSTQITAEIAVASDAKSGPRDVSVTTPGGTSILSGALIVESQSCGGPLVWLLATMAMALAGLALTVPYIIWRTAR